MPTGRGGHPYPPFMESNGRTKPLWSTTATLPRFQPLPGDCSTDVVVIGAGITGITAALLLKQAGKRVLLIDGLGVLGGETGRTTAHATQILDRRYQQLGKRLGPEELARIAQSHADAIDFIEGLVREHQLDCGFERVPGYLYAETAAQETELRREFEAARSAGLEVSLTDELQLPFEVKLAMRVERQAQFDPARYLAPLVAKLPGEGCEVYTHTRVTDVHDGAPCQVVTDHGVIRAEAVFVATNVPINNKLFLITKVAPYRTYAVAKRVESFPRGLYWDMEDPYHYTRVQQTPEGQFLIVGGKDHRVAEENEASAFDGLEAYVRERYGYPDFDFRWSGQVEEPADGLALLGRNSISRNVYVATGLSGNGMTYGTLGALIVSDLILGSENRHAELYDPTRLLPARAAKDYVTENLDFPYHLIRDRLRSPDAREVSEVPIGEGRLVPWNGKKVAIYRDSTGTVHAMSPVCTHMGCHVQWNGAEKSWDCPCHGGRYEATGQVLHGPPVRRLAPVDLETGEPAAEQRVGKTDGDEELPGT